MSGKRQARPRRGSRVSFTRADAQSSPQQTDTVVGLRFTVEAAHGGSALIDFVHLRPRRLALAFASALRELAPTVVRSTVIQHANGLKRFFAFLEDTAAKIDGPEQLRAEHIDGFERWLEAIGVSTIHRHTVLAKLIGALRTVDVRRPGVLDDKLKRRLRYTSARPLGRSTPRDAYSGFVAKQLRDAARADIVTITQRLRSPPPIDHPNPSLRRCLETAAAVIEAEGTVSHRHPKLSYFHSRCYRLGFQGGTPVGALHARRYLLAEDIIPFIVLLSLETGLEPECAKSLRVDCLRNPASAAARAGARARAAQGSPARSPAGLWRARHGEE